jgi:hypothetical protein
VHGANQSASGRRVSLRLVVVDALIPDWSVLSGSCGADRNGSVPDLRAVVCGCGDKRLSPEVLPGGGA